MLILVFIAVFPFAYLAAETWRRAREAQPIRGAVSVEELPDVLEALHLCTEAGMDLLQALGKVIEPRRHEPLGAELYAVVQEVRAGATKTEAWRRLAERVPYDDVRMFVGTLVQAESLGTGPSRLLRGQATAIRERRFQTAERRAGQAVVKLLMPMMCVFASVFVLIFGAVMLAMQEGGGL